MASRSYGWTYFGTAQFYNPKYWTDNLSGKNPAGPPTPSDTANIFYGTAVAQQDVSTSNGGKIIVAYSGTLQVGGQLTVGQSGAGSTTIEAGSHLNASGGVVIGDAGGSTGNLTITGSGATATVTAAASPSTYAVTVGNQGVGTLNVQSGATFNASSKGMFVGPFGTVTVSGAGSSLFNSGNLTLDAGAVNVSSAGGLEIGGQQGAAANTLVIDGGAVVKGHGVLGSDFVKNVKVGNTNVPTYSMTVNDSGTIEANNGTLQIRGNVNELGNGSVEIDPNSQLELSGAFSGTVTFASSGTGSLILDNPGAFAAKNGNESITGLQVGNSIVLQNTTFKNADGVVAVTIGTENGSTTLTIQEADSPADTLNPVALYTIPIMGAPANMAADDFFNVTQSGTSTVLTLTSGNPIDQAVKGPSVPSNWTGQGVTIGVISNASEGAQMKQIILAIAPSANVVVADGAGSDAAFAAAINTLQQQGAKVIVDDLDSGGDDVTAAIKAAVDKGAFYVTSSGNAKVKELPALGMYLPGASEVWNWVRTSSKVTVSASFGHTLQKNVETVGAMNWLAAPQPSSSGSNSTGGYIDPEQNEPFSLAGPSNSGKPDIIAPDGGPTPEKGIGPAFGSSYAAPAVAAVAAMMLQKNPTLKPSTLGLILNTSTDDHHLLDASKAVGNTPLPTAYYNSPGPALSGALSALTLGATTNLGVVSNPGPSVISAALTQPSGDIDTSGRVQFIVALSDGVTVAGGAPALTLNSGATTATYDANASDPSNGILVFDYTVGSVDQATSLAVTGIDPNGATIEDANGNAADFSGLFNVASGLTVNSALVVTSVSASQSSGQVQVGQTIQVDIELGKQVTLVDAGGDPTLTFNDGATATYDTNLSNLSTGKLVFDHTAATGDETPNLAISAVNLPDGTSIQDASGNNTDFNGALNQPLGIQVGAAFVTDFSDSWSGSAAYAGDTVELTLTMSEGVAVNLPNGQPTLTLNDGATATYDGALSNPSAELLTFDYTVGPNDETSQLSISAVNANGAITDRFGNVPDFSNAIGVETDPMSLQVGAVFAAEFDASQTGDADTGTLVTIEAVMSGPVTIDTTNGSPTLRLNDGEFATYDANASDPAIGLLGFDYTVTANDQTPSLEVTQFNPNSAVITDLNGVNAILATPAENTPTGLTINSPFRITGVFGEASANETTGQTVRIVVDMNEVGVFFGGTGTPTLTLNDGGVATFDPANSNVSIGEYAFDYTVGASDYTPALEITGFNLNGATFADSSGANADISALFNSLSVAFSYPSAPIGINQTTIVSAKASVPNEVQPGEALTLTLTMSDPVTVKGLPTLLVATSGAQTVSPESAIYDPNASDPANGKLVFDYTVGTSIYDADYAALEVYQVIGGTITDSNGNPANVSISGFGLSTGVVVGGSYVTQALSSVKSGEITAGQKVTLTLGLAGLAAVDTTNGVPTLTLNDGAVATYDAAASNPSGGTVAFDYTVGPNDRAGTLSALQLNFNGAVFTDIYGQPLLVSSLGNQGAKFQDSSVFPAKPLQVGPITAIEAIAGNGEATTGEQVLVGVFWDGPLNISTTGTYPTLTLSDGAIATYDTSISSPSSSNGADLVFDYTVGANDHSADLGIASLNTNGATITDQFGNAVDLASAQLPTGITVNQPAASINAEASSASPTTGQTVTLSVSLSEALTVDTTRGSPTLTLNDGGIATYNAAASNPSNFTLVFDYVVGSNEHTQNLEVTAFNPNNSTMEDSAGYSPGFAQILNRPLGLEINIPIVSSVTGPPTPEVDAGQTAELTVTMNQSVIINTSGGSPTLALDDGGAATYDTGASSPSAGTLVFDYTPTANEYTPDLTITGISLNGATIVGAANGLTADVSGISQDYLGLNIGVNAEIATCYCPGTLVRTKRGQKRVERLKIGDKIATLSGAFRPIKWIGRRSYAGRFLMGRKYLLPICVKAGALDDSVPRRDLWISPQHAMYLEGVLIEAKDLINGVSIVQPEHVDQVEYFHIELDNHDVIFAEGAPSETFVDDDSRGMFHNAHEYALLYPGAPRVAARYCAPRLDAGYEVERARRHIAARADLVPTNADQLPLRGNVDDVTPYRIAGWAQNPDHPEAPQCLDIIAGGRVIAQVLANRHREDLERAGLGSGAHGFEFVPPPDLAFAPQAVEVRRSYDGASLLRSDGCEWHPKSRARISVFRRAG